MDAAPDPSASRDEDSMRTMGLGSEPELGRIDQYAVLRRLGGGGYGVVYLARDTVSGVLFALKTLHPLVKRNPEELERVRRSFALVSGLAHDGIAGARVLHEVRAAAFSDETARRELLLSPGDFVMVLTYAPGVTLSAWTRQFPNGVAPLARALEVGAQVAAALDYAHGKGVVHRDVKPGNVMVETLAAESPQALDHGHGGALPPGAPKIRVRILDFGLAAEIRSSMSRISTEQGDTSGTRPYMAPEQWLGRKQDGRTDQYALACVLYELLSGAPPFSGVFETGDPMIMKSAVTTDLPDEIEDLNPAANDAFLRALAKSPKDRFPTCAAFVQTLGGTIDPDLGSTGEVRGNTDELEAKVLRRKDALSRALAAVSAEDRADAALSGFLATAETELAAADEAVKSGRFFASVDCLAKASVALIGFDEKKRKRREEAERAAQAEAERLRKEKEELAKQCLLRIVPRVSGRPVQGASLTINGESELIEDDFKLEPGVFYPEMTVSCTIGNVKYARTIDAFQADWKGVKELRVSLSPVRITNQPELVSSPHRNDDATIFVAPDNHANGPKTKPRPGGQDRPDEFFSVTNALLGLVLSILVCWIGPFVGIVVIPIANGESVAEAWSGSSSGDGDKFFILLFPILAWGWYIFCRWKRDRENKSR